LQTSNSDSSPTTQPNPIKIPPYLIISSPLHP
jgi:hypothetical protein